VLIFSAREHGSGWLVNFRVSYCINSDVVLDHDLDGDGSSQITVWSGRGILSESAGPVWMIGTGTSVSRCDLFWIADRL
jgi:hypothetical protein